MSLENMRTRIRFEMESIDRLLFESYTEFLAQVQSKEPNLVEMTALAGVLHSFYTLNGHKLSFCWVQRPEGFSLD